MTALPRARRRDPGAEGAPAGVVRLTHAERLVRRRRLVTDRGEAFLLDLPATTDLADGDRLVLEDGRTVDVEAAPEPLLEVTGDLARLAWHVGNRHAACRIEPHRLLVADDSVMADMLRGLGASVRPVREPFAPEGGAYGHGRTLPHDHGHPVPAERPGPRAPDEPAP